MIYNFVSRLYDGMSDASQQTLKKNQIHLFYIKKHSL